MCAEFFENVFSFSRTSRTFSKSLTADSTSGLAISGGVDLEAVIRDHTPASSNEDVVRRHLDGLRHLLESGLPELRPRAHVPFAECLSRTRDNAVAEKNFGFRILWIFRHYVFERLDTTFQPRRVSTQCSQADPARPFADPRVAAPP